MTIALKPDFPSYAERPRLVRKRLSHIDPFRIFRGGRIGDTGRLPRYFLIFVLAAAALWAPVIAYVRMTPPSYTSGVSLILPGSGAQASVNLADIGQASSSANSAFASSAVSPTETYKRLLSANRLLDSAAARLGLERAALGKPKVKLVDQTSLIHFDMTGPTPEAAQDKADTLLAVFFDELDQLRDDELANRETASQDAMGSYSGDLNELRSRIEDVKRTSGLVSLEHYEDLVASRDRQLDRLEEMRAKFRAAEAEVDSMALQLGIDPTTAALNLRLHADSEFLELAAKHSDHSAEFANLRGRYGAKHPQVTSAQRSRDGAQEKLVHRAVLLTGLDTNIAENRLDMAPDGERGELLSKLVSLDSLRSGLSAQVERLETQINESDARLVELAPQAAQLDDLTRDYKVAEAVLASALARTDTSKSDVYASYPLVQVLEDASLPDAPSSPKIKIAIAAGIAATIMVLFSLSLAWIRRPLIDRILTAGPSK